MSTRRPTLVLGPVLGLLAGSALLGAPAHAQDVRAKQQVRAVDVLTTGSLATGSVASAPAAAPLAPSAAPKPLSPEAQQKVSCRPFDEKGAATRILSTNDVCPQFAFFREDCQRDVKEKADVALYGAHCLDRQDFLNFRY